MDTKKKQPGPDENTKGKGPEETALATVEAAGELVASERPSFFQAGDEQGTEGIGVNDIKLPRLAIAQGMSPQMQPDKAKYIDNLKLYEMFNDLTGEVFHRGPLQFIPVRRDVRRIQFDENDRNKVLDLDVPADDSRNPNGDRNVWRTVDGERKPPLATKFIEYVVLLLFPDQHRAPEPIVISIKDTNKFNREASTRLDSFIKMRRAPIYAGIYSIESKPETLDNNTFGVPVIKNMGWVNIEALAKYAQEFHNSISGKTIVVERDPGADDDTFDVEKLERESGAPKM